MCRGRIPRTNRAFPGKSILLDSKQAVRPGSVVRRLDNAIHWINRYPVEKCQQNKPRYPRDSDLYGGWCYPPFKQPGPGTRFSKVPKGFRSRKAVTKSRTLRSQSCFVDIFLT